MLCGIVPNLSVAKDRFIIDKIVSGSSQHTSLLQHVQAASRDPLLEVGLEALRIVAVTVDKRVHWAEGCDCHAQVRTSYTSTNKEAEVRCDQRPARHHVLHERKTSGCNGLGGGG